MGRLDFIHNLTQFSVKPYRLFKYRGWLGSFDYKKYLRIQEAGNKKKINNVFAKEENILFLSGYLRNNLENISFGICHGTRRGLEQQWFSEQLRCDVIGSEISETACQFPKTIQWDFHDVKPEWVGKASFVYSNSLDHAYDPAKALGVWMQSLAPGGICIVEHGKLNEKSTKLDPFAAPVEMMPYLILDWSKGTFYVTDILDAPDRGNSKKMTYLKFLILRNRPVTSAGHCP